MGGEIFWYKRASGELADQMKAEAARQTAVLQVWLTERLGRSPWFGGDEFGWADAAAAPMVNQSVHYGMGPAAGTPLAAWHARLRERPSVAASFAEFDPVTGHTGDNGRRICFRRAAARVSRSPPRMDGEIWRD